MAKDFKVKVLADKSSSGRSFVSEVYKVEGNMLLVYDPGTKDKEHPGHFVWVDIAGCFMDDITGCNTYTVTLYKAEPTLL